MKLFLITLLISMTSCAAEVGPRASLRLIRDSFTGEVFLMATIESSEKSDLRIKGIKLFDPAVNVDVTRVSDGKEFANYGGGFAHAPYMKDFVIPEGVDDVVIRIPLPRSEALIADKLMPGEYVFKLRYFSGNPLRVKILEDGSLTPSKREEPKQLENKEKAESGR